MSGSDNVRTQAYYSLVLISIEKSSITWALQKLFYASIRYASALDVKGFHLYRNNMHNSQEYYGERGEREKEREKIKEEKEREKIKREIKK
jgi:hypothetical protein